MRALFLLLFLLGACRDSAAESAPQLQTSSCAQHSFDGSSFTVCAAGTGGIELFAARANETAIRTFADLEAKLGERASDVAFAMNAGMFDEAGRPIGLAIVDSRTVRPANRRKGGGNFHLMPNGIFQVLRDGRAQVVPTSEWQPSAEIRLATQSGPMLVIDGKLHPAFEHDGSSRYIRNGVGIGPDGRPLFAISDEPVSLGKFARLFRDELKARNALFFDGAVSALWDPANHRRDISVPLGPIVVAFKPAASAAGREAPATP